MIELLYERDGIADIRLFRDKKEMVEWLNHEIAMAIKYGMTFRIIALCI